MMAIFTTIGLVVLFASVAFLVKRVWLSSLCPICLGVSLTWLTLTALILSGVLLASHFLLPVSILIGGTVVGIIYQGEKKFKAMHSFLPRTITLIVGLTLAYIFLENISWLAVIAAIIILTPLAYLFFLSQPQASASRSVPATLRELEDKMKDCC